MKIFSTRTIGILLVALVFLINECENIKSSQYCHNNKKQCKKEGSFFVRESCVYSECTYPYSYNCGTHCSQEESTCKSLFRLKHEIRSLDSLRNRMGIERMFEKKLERNNKFLQSIRACHRHVWKSIDVCMRGDKCRVSQKVSTI